MQRIVIVGGGIGGLSSAYFLKQRIQKENKKATITIIEQSERLGGWINSKSFKNQQISAIFECGPRSLRGTTESARTTINLIQDLKLTNEVIFANKAMSGRRFIYRDGNLHPLYNTGIFSLMRNTFLLRAIPSILFELFKPNNGKNKEDETISDFIERRFGKYVAENFIAPLVIGIFGGNYKELSIKSCFPSIYNLEHKYGSILRGSILSSFSKSKDVDISIPDDFKKNRIFSFKKGLSAISDGIYNDINNHPQIVEVLTNSPVLEIRTNDQNISIKLEKQTITADYVISAIPSYQLSNVLISNDRRIEEVKNIIGNIEFASLAVINFLFNDNSFLKEEIKGFGYLIPPSQQQPILGVTFDSITFPQQLSSSKGLTMTVMIGGDISLSNNSIDISDYNKYSDQHLVEIALRAVESQLKVEFANQFKPIEVNVTRCVKAIPQFRVGHAEKVEQLKKLTSSVFNNRLLLAGNSYQYVSVNDLIHNSKKLAYSVPL